MEARKPVSVFDAYQQMIARSKLAEQEAVGLGAPKRQSRAERGHAERETKQFERLNPTRNGLGGAATDRFEQPKADELRKDEDELRNPNLQYSKGTLRSPFYPDEDKEEARVKSGIFSTEELAVAAALDKGVPTNRNVQSKFIPVGYVSVGLFEGKSIDIGMVDALVWQCYLGCARNVEAILRAGYKPQKKYAGYNPITAAIAGRNLQVLKLVLKYAPIAELVNEKDGFGYRALQSAALVPGIDPFEFAREVINAGGHDRDYKWHGGRDGYRKNEPSAAQLCLMRQSCGMNWSPAMFSLLLGVTDTWYRDQEGHTLAETARIFGNDVASRMVVDADKFREEAQNPALTNNRISF